MIREGSAKGGMGFPLKPVSLESVPAFGSPDMGFLGGSGGAVLAGNLVSTSCCGLTVFWGRGGNGGNDELVSVVISDNKLGIPSIGGQSSNSSLSSMIMPTRCSPSSGGFVVSTG